jgi:hypothetical protein
MDGVQPFQIGGPALIQFSGGRSSGDMLRRILGAHGGSLPPDVHVTFENTGLEDPATYRFVERCASEWNVRIRWLEWRPGDQRFEEVGPNSADRAGRWFKELIRERRFLPNAVTRFCTTVLKMRAAIAFARSLGWDDWTSYVGIRHDEPARIARGRARNDSGKEPFWSAWPLDEAGIVEADVLRAWSAESFDLELPSKSFGNCRLCHLKAREKLLEVLLADLSAGDWWIDAEDLVSDLVARGESKTVIVDGLFGHEELPASQDAARFRKHGWTYRQMRDYVRDHRPAAQREVDRFYRDLAAGHTQPDLLDSCLCGVGA